MVADMGRDGRVLGDQLLDVVGVALGMDGDLRRDGVGPLGGDEKEGGLDAGHHGEKKVQEDVGVGIEGLVMVEDPGQENRVQQGPADDEGEEDEDEGP